MTKLWNEFTPKHLTVIRGCSVQQSFFSNASRAQNLWQSLAISLGSRHHCAPPPQLLNCPGIRCCCSCAEGSTPCFQPRKTGTVQVWWRRMVQLLSWKKVWKNWIWYGEYTPTHPYFFFLKIPWSVVNLQEMNVLVTMDNYNNTLCFWSCLDSLVFSILSRKIWAIHRCFFWSWTERTKKKRQPRI